MFLKILAAIFLIIIEGLAYKYLVFDGLIPLLDSPWNIIFSAVIAIGLIDADIIFIAKLLSGGTNGI